MQEDRFPKITYTFSQRKRILGNIYKDQFNFRTSERESSPPILVEEE